MKSRFGSPALSAASPPLASEQAPVTNAEVATPLDWEWPASPGVFKVYDKYADLEVNLLAGQESWSVPVQGRIETFQFADGFRERTIQQKLVMLTQASLSPASISKFTRSLLLHWPLLNRILVDGPEKLHENWEERVRDVDAAKAAKAILRVASGSGAGPWSPLHRDLIKGLSTNANPAIAAQKARVKNRDYVIDVARQSDLVRVLDTRSQESCLAEWQAEGLTALALIFQHGMRPVQLLSLRPEHIRIFHDAHNNPVCVVSFHQAKQRSPRGAERELARQVKPEWAGPIAQLLKHAADAGRTRLFACRTSSTLWGRVEQVCAQAGVSVDFSANGLRHTSAQTLADAGHSRKSIQGFLGHSNENAATTYLQASKQQADRINDALGTSKLYGTILSLASGQFVSYDEMTTASEDQQIGGIVGHRLVSGVGLCRAGQSQCAFNPVTSCYGCQKYIPSLQPAAHMEAIAGMREQVLEFLSADGQPSSPAYQQLMRALAGAQQALDAARSGNEDE
ncbi:site-specific integrase [Achromobacter sp.]|uniref:site-specific integrase n=1 Tax=Achromobacter sp. TaxID=134375 RepID=UPI00257AA25F|nr:site-specific integrase [Achromobacter sp.]